MKGLYGQDDAGVAEAEDEEYSLVGGLKEAFVSIPENLSGVWSGLIDPLGFAGAEEEAHDGSEDENKSTIDSLKRHFPKGVHQMYSFLLFVLLYIPCLAATGVVFREIGKLYGTIFVGYLTLLGWSVATIYHAVMVSHSGLWLVVGTSILLAMFGAFWLYGKKHRVDMI
jgi:ferrous iron transport protein B